MDAILVTLGFARLHSGLSVDQIDFCCTFCSLHIICGQRLARFGRVSNPRQDLHGLHFIMVSVLTKDFLITDLCHELFQQITNAYFYNTITR